MKLQRENIKHYLVIIFFISILVSINYSREYKKVTDGYNLECYVDEKVKGTALLYSNVAEEYFNFSILTAVQPFTSKLILSNPSMFRYELIWEKNRGSDFLNSSVKPLNAHENILVFYNKTPAYNPQKTQSKRYKKVKPKSKTFRNYNPHTRVPTESKDGSRFPTTVLKFNRVENNLHPTQKPLKLFEWLLKTYSNEGDLVLDPFLGVGTTALACLRLQRTFIAFELERKYCEIAEKRTNPFKDAQKRLTEFQEVN